MLKADGWYEVNVVGSHHQFKHPIKPGRCTLKHPDKDIPRKTLDKHRKTVRAAIPVALTLLQAKNRRSKNYEKVERYFYPAVFTYEPGTRDCCHIS